MNEDEEFEALEQRLNMKEQEYEQINHPNGVTTWKTKPKVKPEALRLADEIEWIAAGKAGKETAAELRSLHEAHDWQYKMAGDRLRRIEKLERVNQELLIRLKEARELVNDWGESASYDDQVRYGLSADLSMLDATIAKAQGAINE